MGAGAACPNRTTERVAKNGVKTIAKEVVSSELLLHCPMSAGRAEDVHKDETVLEELWQNGKVTRLFCAPILQLWQNAKVSDCFTAICVLANPVSCRFTFRVCYSEHDKIRIASRVRCKVTLAALARSAPSAPADPNAPGKCQVLPKGPGPSLHTGPGLRGSGRPAGGALRRGNAV